MKKPSEEKVVSKDPVEKGVNFSKVMGRLMRNEEEILASETKGNDEKVKKEIDSKDGNKKEVSKVSLDGQGVTSKELELVCEECTRTFL